MTFPTVWKNKLHMFTSSNKQQKKCKDGMGKAGKGKDMVKDWCGASCVWKNKYE